MTISLQIYCTCGSYLCGAVSPADADQLMRAFAALHQGDDHAPCQAWNAPTGFGHNHVDPGGWPRWGLSVN